jgi:hypothetical protein
VKGPAQQATRNTQVVLLPVPHQPFLQGPQAVNLARIQRLSAGVGAASRSLLPRSAFVMEGRKVTVPRAPELSAESPSSAGFKTYSAAGSADRISLVSGHLSHQSSSSYNAASPTQVSSSAQARRLSTTTATMSSQPEHATLLIPGPIEFDDEVLKSMGHYRYDLDHGCLLIITRLLILVPQ